MEEGGASRRNDQRARREPGRGGKRSTGPTSAPKRGRRAASEWLPKSQADEEQPKRPAQEPEPAADREGKKEAAQPTAKPKQSGEAKQSGQPKRSGKQKQSRAAKEPGQTRQAERAKQTAARRRRDEHVHVPSDVDALGQDKHRKVIGQHNPNRSRQLFYYGIFIAFIVVAYLGLQAAVDQLDKAPAHDPASAPWAQRGAPQIPLGGFEPRKQGQKGPTHFQ